MWAQCSCSIHDFVILNGGNARPCTLKPVTSYSELPVVIVSIGFPVRILRITFEASTNRTSRFNPAYMAPDTPDTPISMTLTILLALLSSL